jgi:hypothetical protein
MRYHLPLRLAGHQDHHQGRRARGGPGTRSHRGHTILRRLSGTVPPPSSHPGHRRRLLPVCKGKITPEIIEIMDRWRHSGFNVYCGPRILPRQKRSLERPAAMGTHVPGRGQQSVRYYGFRSNAARGKRGKEQQEGQDPLPTVPESDRHAIPHHAILFPSRRRFRTTNTLVRFGSYDPALRTRHISPGPILPPGTRGHPLPMHSRHPHGDRGSPSPENPSCVWLAQRGNLG